MDSDIVVDKVSYIDQHCIIFPGIKSGSWELPINGDNGFAWTQSSGILQHHLHPLPEQSKLLYHLAW